MPLDLGSTTIFYTVRNKLIRRPEKKVAAA
jgi:hypothetical protein